MNATSLYFGGPSDRLDDAVLFDCVAPAAGSASSPRFKSNIVYILVDLPYFGECITPKYIKLGTLLVCNHTSVIRMIKQPICGSLHISVSAFQCFNTLRSGEAEVA